MAGEGEGMPGGGAADAKAARCENVVFLAASSLTASWAGPVGRGGYVGAGLQEKRVTSKLGSS